MTTTRTQYRQLGDSVWVPARHNETFSPNVLGDENGMLAVAAIPLMIMGWWSSRSWSVFANEAQPVVDLLVRLARDGAVSPLQALPETPQPSTASSTGTPKPTLTRSTTTMVLTLLMLGF